MKNYLLFYQPEDDTGNWQPRSHTWTKTKKKAKRKVVDIKYDLKDKTKCII